MADKNDDMKARMLAALEAKKNKPGAPGTQNHSETGSKIRGGQRSGGAPQVQRKAGPSGSVASAKSCPAQKAFPSPVITIALTSSFNAASSNAFWREIAIPWLKEL